VHRIGVIVSPGYQMMSLGALSAFEFANRELGEPAYEVRILSETGGPVLSSIGVPIETKALDDSAFDTIIATGAMVIAPSTPGIIAFLKDAPRRARRIASICTGAFVLAEAGLLDGRRATTHWFYARKLQAEFPKVKMEEDRIYVVDGTIWTSAGMSAGIDLALAMVEEDHGAETARAVARKLVVYHRRAGGQSQFSALLDLQPKSDRVQSVLDYARRNLDQPLSVKQLAEVAHLSPRQFSRAFQAETGQSPAKAIENLRLEAARIEIERSRHSIDQISLQTGFGDPDRMRRAFLRAFGQPPQAIRRNAQGETIDIAASAIVA
jgi:transcriptional regulator GlxA family with amidase domain